MRPILVAGTTGQLARSMVDIGEQRAIPVIAVGRPKLDLGDADSIYRAVRTVSPLAIVNAAAYTAVDMAESEPERAFAVNRDGAGRLAAAARFFRVPFVHVSTDYVFDGCKASPYYESDDPYPLGVYGQSKLAGENAVMSENPEAIVFRTSWVYSPYGTNFLKTMLRLAETRDVVGVINDQHGAPTAAIDLAGALVDALMQIVARGVRGRAGVYHVTASGQTTWYGFASAIFADWCNRDNRIPQLEAITTADYPTRVKRPANSRLNCQKAKRVFGICLPPWSTSLGPCLDVLADARPEVQL